MFLHLGVGCNDFGVVKGPCHLFHSAVHIPSGNALHIFNPFGDEHLFQIRLYQLVD